MKNNMTKNYRYELKVTDENTEEVIYLSTRFSWESLEESYHKLEGAIKKHEEDEDKSEETLWFSHKSLQEELREMGH